MHARDPALVRPLAQGHRHRRHGRAAGALLGDGRQRMAQRRPTGRCRRRSGPNFISTAGSGSRCSRSRRRACEDELPPDAFVQMPPTQTNRIAKLRYLSDPLPEDLLVAGPSVAQSVRRDRSGRHQLDRQRSRTWDRTCRCARCATASARSRDDLPERELTRGWLKASHRAVDPARSKPWKPWHPLTRKAQKKVVPGEITEYKIEITGDRQPVPPRPSHLRRDHRAWTCRPA